MTYVLTGPNAFVRLAEKRKLVKAFVKKYGDIGLETLDCATAEADRVRSSLESLPFLAPKKLVVLEQPSANKNTVEMLLKVLPELSDTTVVIVHEPKFDKRSAYYKFCKKLDTFKEFTELDGYALQKWAGDYVKKWEATINAEAAKELVVRCGSDQLRLSNELDKLCMYTVNIDVPAVELLTEKPPTSTIFELIDAAFSSNTKHALTLYKEQRAMQVDPIQIMAMFTWQFQILAIVKTAPSSSQQEIAKQAKLNPFVVKKAQTITQKLSLAQIKQFTRTLREIDTKMKSSRINADDALQAFIISLSSS